MQCTKVPDISPLQIEGLSSAECSRIEDRLDSICRSWEGTPHMDGQQAKGRGVDCVRFVAAVLDEMQGTRTELEKLPRDAAFHAREKCFTAFRLFIRQFDGYEIPEGEPVQPGDVLVVGPVTGGPGHAIIVGKDGQLWHSAGSVTRTGMGCLDAFMYKYKAAFRAKDRGVKWA